MAKRASARDVLRIRLAAQRISTPVSSVTEVVRHLLALQAQDFGSALWAVALRTRSARRADVLAALEQGTVVRSLPMRGTLHFVPAEDLRWMLALTAGRTLQSAATRFRGLGLDDATFDRAANLTIAALQGGRRLGRAEFVAMLEAAGISCEGQRGYHIIFQLAQRAIVCWGPPSGTQQALVLVDEWIPDQPTLEHDEALRRFALSYFAGHGPATVRDFAWWTKLTLTDARRGVAAAADELTELAVGDGESYWVTTLEAESAPSRLSGTSALPGFDEYLLGYQDRSLALAEEHFERIVPGSNGIFLPIIVTKGEVVGTWRRVAKANPPAISPEHFVTASPAELDAFSRAAARYSRFA